MQRNNIDNEACEVRDTPQACCEGWCQALLDALSGREELTELDLGDNLIGAAGAEVIGKFIGDRDNLMKLRVSNNLLGDAAAGMVCRLLSTVR